MVVDQGTVLDRIDFNVQSAKENTEMANKNLEGVLESEQSPRARSCIRLLVAMIMVCLFVLILKHY